MHILYGITANYLQLPMYIRIIGEIVILLFGLLILLLLIKLVLIGLFWTLSKICHPIFSGLRCCICMIYARKKNVYEWDQKIGVAGQNAIDFFKTKREKASEWHLKNVLLKKSSILLIVLFYFVAIFPFIGLDKFIDERYLASFYIVNDIFAKIEEPFVEKAKDYPPLITWKNTEEVVGTAVESEDGDTTEGIEETEEPVEPIYLILGEDIYYANVRESARIDSETICVVSKEDIILFMNEYEDNGNRRWLRVLIESKGNIEGWMSEAVFEIIEYKE